MIYFIYVQKFWFLLRGFGIIQLVPTRIIRSNKNDLVSKTKSKQITENAKQKKKRGENTYLASL